MLYGIKVRGLSWPWKQIKLRLMFLKPLGDRSRTVAWCIILLEVTISIREHDSHKWVHVVGYYAEVLCAV